jgi:hypothetical protein
VSISSNTHDIYLEIGKKRVFAGAVEWPGWCRAGRDEAAAVQALLDTGPRYAQILESTGLGFEAPQNASALHVVQRLEGTSTTDFGAPDRPVSRDSDPIDAGELQRFETLLEACWAAFDAAVEKAASEKARGKQLRKGPRGGGRDLEGIVNHVLMANIGYLKRIGRNVADVEDEEAAQRLDRVRGEILDGLAAGAAGELPTEGPRGGKRWGPRYFVRRVAWHVVDHAWEIEDRIV